MQNEPVSPSQGPGQPGPIDPESPSPIMAAADVGDAEAKHVLASKTIAGVVLLLLPVVAKKLGLQLSDADAQAVAEQVVEFIGAGLAIYGRCTATQRLTLKTAGGAGKVAGVLLGGWAAGWLVGCATDTGDARKDRAGRVTNAVMENLLSDAGQLAVGALEQTVLQAATKDTSGRALQEAAATGLWQSLGTIDVAADVARIVAAWNGGSSPQVAQAAAHVFTTAAPTTAAEKTAVANFIAAKISQTAEGQSNPSAAGALLP